ncbi:hypothetical protein, partial [Actinoallomurus spadix]|uniref:hypothetical protein n=1 Tax=Actinoallomurus spadix TaxID=79912 RepID=UPI0031D0667A
MALAQKYVFGVRLPGGGPANVVPSAPAQAAAGPSRDAETRPGPGAEVDGTGVLIPPAVGVREPASESLGESSRSQGAEAAPAASEHWIFGATRGRGGGARRALGPGHMADTALVPETFLTDHEGGAIGRNWIGTGNEPFDLHSYVVMDAGGRMSTRWVPWRNPYLFLLAEGGHGWSLITPSGRLDVTEPELVWLITQDPERPKGAEIVLALGRVGPSLAARVAGLAARVAAVTGARTWYVDHDVRSVVDPMMGVERLAVGPGPDGAGTEWSVAEPDDEGATSSIVDMYGGAESDAGSSFNVVD